MAAAGSSVGSWGTSSPRKALARRVPSSCGTRASVESTNFFRASERHHAASIRAAVSCCSSASGASGKWKRRIDSDVHMTGDAWNHPHPAALPRRHLSAGVQRPHDEPCRDLFGDAKVHHALRDAHFDSVRDRRCDPETLALSRIEDVSRFWNEAAYLFGIRLARDTSCLCQKEPPRDYVRCTNCRETGRNVVGRSVKTVHDVSRDLLHTRPTPPLRQLRQPRRIDRLGLLVLPLPRVIPRGLPLGGHLGELGLFPLLPALHADALQELARGLHVSCSSRASPS